jgi:hypothetical protein
MISLAIKNAELAQRVDGEDPRSGVQFTALQLDDQTREPALSRFRLAVVTRRPLACIA